jgi:hypothetical protein
MAPTLDQQRAADALALALGDRRPAPGLLVHSDRGGPYLATRMQPQLAAHRAIASTSRPGMGTARPPSTRPTTSAGLNRVSTFLGQLQSAACAG